MNDLFDFYDPDGSRAAAAQWVRAFVTACRQRRATLLSLARRREAVRLSRAARPPRQSALAAMLELGGLVK